MSSSTKLREMAEYHARECVRAANLTDDAENRELLLKMAREWAQEAQRRGSHACLHRLRPPKRRSTGVTRGMADRPLRPAACRNSKASSVSMPAARRLASIHSPI